MGRPSTDDVISLLECPWQLKAHVCHHELADDCAQVCLCVEYSSGAYVVHCSRCDDGVH